MKITPAKNPYHRKYYDWEPEISPQHTAFTDVSRKNTNHTLR